MIISGMSLLKVIETSHFRHGDHLNHLMMGWAYASISNILLHYSMLFEYASVSSIINCVKLAHDGGVERFFRCSMEVGWGNKVSGIAIAGSTLQLHMCNYYTETPKRIPQLYRSTV